MSDAVEPSETAATPEATPADLLDNLRELGQALPVNFQPNAHDAGAITAGMVWYLATGSLEPPVVETPDEAEQKQALSELTALNAEKAKVAELERKLGAQSAGPAAVAPQPVAPVAAEPTPTPPVETPAAPPTTPPVEETTAGNPSHVDPAEAKPINANVPPVGEPPAQG